MKACINCQHKNQPHPQTNWDHWTCDNPEYLAGNVVTGEQWARPCKIVRANLDLCGPNGDGFEQKRSCP